MKYLLLGSLVLVGCVGSPAFANCGAGDLNCDGRVTGAEAWESGQPYRDAVNAVRVPAPREGLPPLEDMGYPIGEETKGESGKWVKISNYAIDVVNAGAYSLLLTPNSEGEECSVGDKGIIMGTTRPCTSWNSGGWHCQRYGAEEVTPTSGYKAECKK